MVKRVWGSRQVDGAGELVGAADIGKAPLALLVEHLPPHGDLYRIRLQMVVRDAAVKAAIDRHHLWDLQLHVDKSVEVLAKERDELKEKLSEGFGNDPFYGWSLDIAALGGRAVKNWWKSQSAVEVTVGALYRGLEIKGRMDEVTWVSREVSGAIDKLSGKLIAGDNFDGRKIQIYAPGGKDKDKKPKKPSTPPSEWR